MGRLLPPYLVCAAAFAAASVHADALTDAAGMWHRHLDAPEGYSFRHEAQLVKRYSFPDFDCELYEQANGPGTRQRVVMALPKGLKGNAPAVVVPFYFPEAMLGFELETQEPLPTYADRTIMADLARRGFVCASADAYHLTYAPSSRERGDFRRWAEAAERFNRDWPSWTGIGKLTADTRLVIDLLCADARVDPSRIGAAGHSLGGKMAFYAGCLDPRVKAILASDFGLGWDQSNWSAAWYWGDKLPVVRAAGLEQTQLLTLSGAKPFFLIAGKYDDIASFGALARTAGYAGHPERLCGIDHATGHRPPRYALEAGYAFLERELGMPKAGERH